MHDMTDTDQRELHEHQERRRMLNVLLSDHICLQCYVSGSCEWKQRITEKRDEYDREVKRIARLVGITEPI